ncbi:excinuclease ABC subunit A [Saccharothrix tamanrassetensis]|uniref:UvrABC system protein A n=1 Tax=Saccharothrix tamanrassetensis TaxID=1051531 RepID=A0A841CWD9_9PSEU|nr:excinuclease ABC subunit UvrA [Saccharothrix tamanrassetensis]MBB5959686.1 excinuclease ABC subunit A [Saccharothrix tamanrassetensis]
MSPFGPGAETAVGEHGFIEVTGARTHNLRDVSVRIPRGRLVAFTGVSGSGKTSLALDTIHAEAQQRYLEGLSPFVRQYISQRDRPKVDRITGLGATLAVDQRRVNGNPRSTVATITGIDGHLGLLYSRLPSLAEPGLVLSTAHFDQHSPEGACPRCHGAGGEWRAAVDLIITDPAKPLFAGASPWFAKWRSTEHHFVPALAEKRGVDLDVPWRDLPEQFRHEVLHGTGDEVIDASFTAENRTKTGSWSFSDSQPMIGALAEVERVVANAATPSAKQRYAPYLRKSPCERCGGTGFGDAARTVTLAGASYERLVDCDVREVREWVSRVDAELTGMAREVGEPLLAALVARLDLLDRLGVAHVQLSRSAASLSGGEVQRTRLAAQLSTELTGITFVLDEPGTGLHPADKAHLLRIVTGLRDAGNTVLLVEHDPELIAHADWVVDIGPGAGTEGGRLLASGPPAGIAATEGSVTGRYLRGGGARVHRTPRPVDAGTEWLVLHDVKVHNVVADAVRFPLGKLVCLTGVSGSGKSSLLRDALGGGVRAALAGEACEAVHRVENVERVDWVAVVDQDPIGRTPRSNPATYTKAFDLIRKLFADTDRARELGFTASSFSFNASGGRCEVCTGHGRKLVNMHFLPDIWVTCDACEGRRFTADVLTVTYRDMTVDDVLRLTVSEAVRRFDAPKRLAATLQALEQVGLGYLQLGQSATDLSGGEAQRLKLASAIQRGQAGPGRGLVVMDEPVSGLHPADIQRVVDAFEVLLAAGNTVVVAEHDLHLAAGADWLVDLGPGAGAQGGRVVAEGTPADVADGEGGTAAYLRRVRSGEPLLGG